MLPCGHVSGRIRCGVGRGGGDGGDGALAPRLLAQERHFVVGVRLDNCAVSPWPRARPLVVVGVRRGRRGDMVQLLVVVRDEGVRAVAQELGEANKVIIK